jgi:hypothetical protein
MEKLKVFVSHSFDKADAEIVAKILDIMRRPRFHLEVRTAQPSEARPFSDKIWDLIDWADVTFGILTQRSQDGESGNSYPSHFVVSECSTALGRYRDNEKKAVVGIVEQPIEHKTLGLNAAKGEEFPHFSRSNVLADAQTEVTVIEQYLHDLYERHGARLGQIPVYPYKQRNVRKTVEIYRSGLGILKNKNTIVINNAREFIQRGNRIEHRIWLQNRNAGFPDFQDMLKTSITQRHVKPFFVAMFSGTKREPERPMKAMLMDQGPQMLRIGLEFPFPVKDSDILEYQYSWGMPGAFYGFEDDQPEGLQYQSVSVRSLHGKIDTAELEIKFERETVSLTNPQIFSKEPFAVFAASPDGDGATSEPIKIVQVTRDPIFEVYEHSTKDLTGTMIIKWRPASRAYIQSELDASASSRPPFKPIPSRVPVRVMKEIEHGK